MDEHFRCEPRARVIKALVETRGYAPTARKLGTSAGYLHDIANGRKRGSVEILTKLADEFDVALEDIAVVTGVRAAA